VGFGWPSQQRIALTIARTRHAEGRVDRRQFILGEHDYGLYRQAARRLPDSGAVMCVSCDSTETCAWTSIIWRVSCPGRPATTDLVPVCVFAAAGQTNTGAIDPLAERCFLLCGCHVDAANGVCFKLTTRTFAGGRIERATHHVDPHKSSIGFLALGPIGAIRGPRSTRASRNLWRRRRLHARISIGGHTRDFKRVAWFRTVVAGV